MIGTDLAKISMEDERTQGLRATSVVPKLFIEEKEIIFWYWRQSVIIFLCRKG